MPSARLGWHTLVAVTLALCFIVGPAMLELRDDLGLGQPGLAMGLTLLGAGSASLVGAGISRWIDRSACSALQWRMMMVAVWLLNPVGIVVVSVLTQWRELAWWSALPLAGAISLLSGRLRLAEGEPDWARDGCPPRPSQLVHWLISRVVFVVFPMCLVSFQVALYLPRGDMLPQGPEIGLFVCGGCVLISSKFCTMCHCITRQKLSQAMVLVILLSADWISALHLMELVTDMLKENLLLMHLFVAGIIQWRISASRLKLRPRWARALSRRQARDMNPSGDMELGAHINAHGSGGNDSSDSDDDRGPGSLPDGFHDTMGGVVGLFASQAQTARRQFLCAPRSAFVQGGIVQQAQGGVTGTSMVIMQPISGERTRVAPQAPAPPRPADVAAAAAVDADAGAGVGVVAEPPVAASEETDTASTTTGPASAGSSVSVASHLEIVHEERLCTICQDEIKTGDVVRPLPKCAHVFHAECLERWAKTMREGTRCPTCRRPALARRPADGAISISALEPTEAESSSTRATSRGSSSASSEARGSRPARPSNGSRPNRRATRAAGSVSLSAATNVLRSSLHVSVELAQAALETASGAPEVAAHILIEHRFLLEATYASDPSAVGGSGQVGEGVVEAFIAANPNLVGFDAHLRRHIGALVRSGRLQPRPWAELSATERRELFVTVIQDVVRSGLEERR